MFKFSELKSFDFSKTNLAKDDGGIKSPKNVNIESFVKNKNYTSKLSELLDHNKLLITADYLRPVVRSLGKIVELP